MGDSPKALDTTVAEAYERLLVPAFTKPLAAEAMDLAALQTGEHVLDVACGTGIAVRLALPHVAPGGKVAGLDSDPSMLAVARTMSREPGDVAAEWHCASAMAMPFSSGTFDAVFCLQGLQFLPDCAAGLAEMRRVMKPKGRLVAVVWNAVEHCQGHYAIVEALNRRNLDAAPILKALSLGHPGKLRGHATEAGFRDLNIRSASMNVRFPSASDYVGALAEGGPGSRLALTQVRADQQCEFLNEIGRALRQYRTLTASRFRSDISC